MQSLEARAQYRNSLHCAYRTFTEGLRRFWTGTMPRLATGDEWGLEWGNSLYDLRKNHRAHWWARVIDTGNKYIPHIRYQVQWYS
ncbi:hypothetical protein EDB84DRAFT_1469687 [Lactarius hengduanensis]|nr:hypothetical protein EDB84DRAFT_1469687 [Lactarius hengduanensis]